MIDSQETVNDDFFSDIIDIDDQEGPFAIQFNYDNGNGFVDMDLYIQASVDGIAFADVSLLKNITDDSGSHIWDVSGTGTSFIRIKIVVNDGSIDIQNIIYSGKRRH